MIKVLGSFTGIRIGIATAKAFSDSLNIPCVGISSLEALCLNVETNDLICSMLDARNENVYWSCFDNNYILKHEFSVGHLNSVLEILKKYNTPITFVGDGAVCYKEKILQILPNSNFCSQNNLSAYKLGLAYFNNLKNDLNNDISPLYLRKPQAEQMLEERLNGSK